MYYSLLAEPGPATAVLPCLPCCSATASCSFTVSHCLRGKDAACTAPLLLWHGEVWQSCYKSGRSLPGELYSSDDHESIQESYITWHSCIRDSGRPLLKPGKISPKLEVPEHILRPPYVKTGENPWIEQIQVHNAQVCVIQCLSLFS